MTSRYLLDTNIVSELCKKNPDFGVVDFVSGLDRFWLSVITIHELKFGIELLPIGERRSRLAATVQEFTDSYSAHVIDVNHAVASLAGDYRAQNRLAGTTLHLADALIAAMSVLQNGLVVATRNISDFTQCAVELHNPFTV